MGTLYLVATPIGNLEDITLRGLRVLGEVGTVAAEDTRTGQRLLTHHGIQARLLSYNEHNRAVRIPRILELLESTDVALISEAGTPAISDPGRELVSAAIAAGHPVCSVPGASAVLTALTASGLETREFLYIGFLPRQPGERRAALRGVSAEPRTLVCFEAPSRIKASLRDMLTCLGDRQVALCRELTKLHEEISRGRISDLLAGLDRPRGEFTVVIEASATAPPALVDDDARRRLAGLRAGGATARDATAQLAAELGLPRRRVYEAWLELSSLEEGEKTPC